MSRPAPTRFQPTLARHDGDDPSDGCQPNPGAFKFIGPVTTLKNPKQLLRVCH